MKLAKHIKSLKNAAVEREIQIAEMNAKHWALQAELLARDQSLAAIQAEMVQYASALVESRRMLTEKLQHRHSERQRFTNSTWWKVGSFVSAPFMFLGNLRRGNLRNRIRSLEALVSSRDEQLNGLNAQAAALADVLGRKDQLLADLNVQAALNPAGRAVRAGQTLRLVAPAACTVSLSFYG
jgi:hypothetical protein